MSSTTHVHLDRKELKKPDTILVKINSFFQFFRNNLKPVLVVLGALVILTVVIFSYRSLQASRQQDAASAIYIATKSLKVTLQGLPKDAADWKEKLKPHAQEIEKAAVKYVGTSAAFEGWTTLARAYVEKGDLLEGAHYFERAATETKEVFFKVSALLQAGLIFEDLKKNDESVRVLSLALPVNEKIMRPNVLMALGRNYALLGNSAKAKETYDLIVKEFPNSSYSVTAEQQKKSLEKK